VVKWFLGQCKRHRQIQIPTSCRDIRGLRKTRRQCHRYALGLGLGRYRVSLILRCSKNIEVDEFVAGGDEGTACLPLAESVDRNTLLADARGETCKIAVAGRYAEAGESIGVEHVHGSDDHSAISGILMVGVGELLYGQDGIVGQNLLPAAQGRLGPIAIDTSDANVTIVRNLRHQPSDDPVRNIVAIDQQGQVSCVVQCYRRVIRRLNGDVRSR
jgi:hypothetical protein